MRRFGIDTIDNGSNSDVGFADSSDLDGSSGRSEGDLLGFWVTIKPESRAASRVEEVLGRKVVLGIETGLGE